MDSLEKLLLLEILVDNVYYEKTAIDPDLLSKLQDTNVRFKFFDFPPIDVGEVDFCQTGEGFDNSEVTFKSGKSVLFAMPDISDPTRQPFDLNVTVSRKLPVKKSIPQDSKTEDKEKDQTIVQEFKLQDLGKTVIHLGDSFLNLMEATAYEGICPASRTQRDSYQLTNESGSVIGSVTVFVRLSCFGKIIVTQFQADTLGDKSFTFRGGEDEAAPIDSEMPMVGQISRPLYGGAEPSIGPGFMAQNPSMPMMPGMPGMMPPMPGMFPQTIQVPVPLKKKQPVIKCGKVPSELVSSDSEGEKKGPYCIHPNCPQGYQQPPWFSKRKHRTKLNNRQPAKTYPGPIVGSAAFKGNDVIFQMNHPLNPSKPSKVNDDAVFKVNHEPDQPQQNVQLVKKYNSEMDDENDIFLLKFSKTDNEDKPAKLLITMKTPKAPSFNEHKCMSDRTCQTVGELKKKGEDELSISELTPKTQTPSTPPTTTQLAAALGKKGSKSSVSKKRSKTKKKKHH